MTLKDLEGFQLIDLTDSELVVAKDGKTYTLVFHEDKGDCCGYNDLITELLVTYDELDRNPIITNVEIIDKESNDSGSQCVITFFGEYKPLARLDSLSYSGSGWGYGACVSIHCELLDLDETITCW